MQLEGEEEGASKLTLGILLFLKNNSQRRYRLSCDGTTHIHKSDRPIAHKIQRTRGKTEPPARLQTPGDEDFEARAIPIPLPLPLPPPPVDPFARSMDGLQRRPAAAAAASARGEGQPPGGQRVIHCDVEPAPRAWPGMQMLALAAILVLGGLQFLPATHFRHPADRARTWVPFDPSRHPQVPPPPPPFAVPISLRLSRCLFSVCDLRSWTWNSAELYSLPAY